MPHATSQLSVLFTMASVSENMTKYASQFYRDPVGAPESRGLALLLRYLP